MAETSKNPTAKKRTTRSTNIAETDAVAAYMDALDHPLKKEVEEVRKIISDANEKISERIKWNAPSYYYKQDMVTFNLREQKLVHLVFHHPAIVTIKSSLLEGDYPTRRMTYLNNMKEVKASKKELVRIMNVLVESIDSAEAVPAKKKPKQ